MGVAEPGDGCRLACFDSCTNTAAAAAGTDSSGKPAGLGTGVLRTNGRCLPSGLAVVPRGTAAADDASAIAGIELLVVKLPPWVSSTMSEEPALVAPKTIAILAHASTIERLPAARLRCGCRGSIV